MIAIVDSYAWIEFIAGTQHEPRVREILSTADLLITPDIVLAEVARRLARDRLGSDKVREKVEDIATLSQVAPITTEVALGVSSADDVLRRGARSRGLKTPGLSDAVILSTARVFDGQVLTGDLHFKGLPETSWLGP